MTTLTRSRKLKVEREKKKRRKINYSTNTHIYRAQNGLINFDWNLWPSPVYCYVYRRKKKFSDNSLFSTINQLIFIWALKCCLHTAIFPQYFCVLIKFRWIVEVRICWVENKSFFRFWPPFWLLSYDTHQKSRYVPYNLVLSTYLRRSLVCSLP